MVTFRDARHHARMTKMDVGSYLGVSDSTIHRYERTGKAPKAVIECLMMIGGKCPDFSLRNDFKGWSFGDGFMWSPEGDKYTSGDIRAGKLASLEMNRLYRLELREREQKRSTAKIYYFPNVGNVRKDTA